MGGSSPGPKNEIQKRELLFEKIDTEKENGQRKPQDEKPKSKYFG
jgi:hypothetical protein